MNVSAASFGALLSEKIAELDAAEETPYLLVEETMLDRLRLDTRHSVLALEGGPLPRQGHAAYVTSSDTPVEPGKRKLNLVY